jgi:hypothetical protein
VNRLDSPGFVALFGFVKKILLLGDSIRLGYCGCVRDELAGYANVFYPEDNCRYTQYTMVNLDSWLNLAGAPGEFDLVHWNNGHWDAACWNGEAIQLNPPDQYAVMLERIHGRLRAACPRARIVFALTTAMNPDGSQSRNRRTNADIERHNAAARAVMDRLGVPVNDLYAVTKNFAASYYLDHAHLVDEGYRVLGRRVAGVIRTELSLA